MITRPLKSRIIEVRIVSSADSGIILSGALGMSFCLGFTTRRRLQYVGSVGIDTKQKQQVGLLRPKKTTTFYDRQPGKKSHWSGEAAGPWKPVAPTKVVEVRYDHFSDQRFRHGCTFLRVRPDKLAKDCLLEQVFRQTVIHDISAFIDAGLATAGTNRKIKPYLDRLYANL
jgi:ATP-dependent DNA ligase